MHLTYPNYEHHSLGYLAYYAQYTYTRLQLGKVISHKAYFIIKYWIAYAICWTPYWKWKTLWSNGYRMIVNVLAIYLADYMAGGS